MLTNKTMATDSKTQDKYKSCLQCCSALMFNIVDSTYKFSAGDDVVSIYLTCVHKKTLCFLCTKSFSSYEHERI